jgi:hypothetical protein
VSRWSPPYPYIVSDENLAAVWHVTPGMVRNYITRELPELAWCIEQPGTGFGKRPATRWYTQELADRLHLPSHTISDMAEALNLEYQTVRKVLRESGTEWPVTRVPGATHPRYLHAEGAQMYVAHATASLRAIPYLNPGEETLPDVARMLGLPDATSVRGHIEKQEDLSSIKILRRRRGDRQIDAITKADYAVFKAWLPLLAPRSWLAVKQHSRQTGWSEPKIRRHIERTAPERRLYRTTEGRIEWHYHVRDIQGQIGLRPKVPPAGDWYSMAALRHYTRRGPRWIRRHMRPDDIPRPRIGDVGKVGLHWPPDVAYRLKTIALLEQTSTTELVESISA